MTPRDRIATALSPDLVAAIEALVDERVAAGLAARASSDGPEWLTLDAAASQLGCSRDAVRMRARRGRLELGRQGRSVYVSARSVRELGGAAA